MLLSRISCKWPNICWVRLVLRFIIVSHWFNIFITDQTYHTVSNLALIKIIMWDSKEGEWMRLVQVSVHNCGSKHSLPHALKYLTPCDLYKWLAPKHISLNFSPISFSVKRALFDNNLLFWQIPDNCQEFLFFFFFLHFSKRTKTSHQVRVNHGYWLITSTSAWCELEVKCVECLNISTREEHGKERWEIRANTAFTA